MIKVAVYGQGYVGLPLAIAASRAGFDVVGIESSKSKIEMISGFNSPTEDLFSEEIKSAFESQNYRILSEIPVDFQPDIFCICVPTPLNDENNPDLSALENVVKQIGNKIAQRSLVIVESTIQPGTTRNLVQPMLEKTSGLSRQDFFVAFSPERIDPMNETWNLFNTPKLVAGLNEESANMAKSFYSKFISDVHIFSSVEVVESAKLLENSFRLVNISFINEFAVVCNKIGIDINEVISAATTKPYGFMPFYPSLGAGGHCIPVDPIYFAAAARRFGIETELIYLASKINLDMPKYFVRRAEEKLNGLQGKKILVVGISYKPNVADVRESPAIGLITGLLQKGAQVDWHDDLVKVWKGKKSVALSENYDLAIIATLHDYLDLTGLGNVEIINTRTSL
jgi:UDP-N-acetyl-D-glucosamine dehydrogenase